MIIRIVFLLVFLAMLIGGNLFLANKTAFYLNLSSKSLLAWVYGIVLFLSVFGIGFLANKKGLAYDVLYAVATILFGLFIISFFILLGIEFFRLFLPFSKQIYGIFAVVSILSFTLYGLIISFSPIVKTIEVPIEGVQKEYHFIQLTDIHLGHLRGAKFLTKVVEKVNQQSPDAVFITGDIFDGDQKVNYETIKPLEKVKVPVYAVTGNHDGYAGLSMVEGLLEKVGVRVLNNEIVVVDGIQLVGLFHMPADEQSFDIHASHSARTIKSVMSELNPSQLLPTILLHHSPHGVEYANKHGVDLFLCGHTHGGQMFPLTLLNRFIFPYNRGLHNYKGTSIYVSDGVGTFGPPLRIGTFSEITAIHVIPKK